MELNLNPQDGRLLDATFTSTPEGLPRLALAPRFDLGLMFQLGRVAGELERMGSPPPAHLLDEGYRLLIHRAAGKSPVLEVSEHADGEGLRVVSGQVTLSSTAGAAPVTAEAGQCLQPREPAPGARRLRGRALPPTPRRHPAIALSPRPRTAAGRGQTGRGSAPGWVFREPSPSFRAGHPAVSRSVAPGVPGVRAPVNGGQSMVLAEAIRSPRSPRAIGASSLRRAPRLAVLAALLPALALSACGESAVVPPGPGNMLGPGAPMTPPTGMMPPAPGMPGPMGTPGTPPAPAMPGLPGAAAFVEKPCAFSPAPTRAVRCGTVSVPEARDGSSTRRVELAVVIVKSDSPTPAPDPLVFLQGGPGGGGTDFTVALTRMPAGPLAAVLARRDVLSIDQRGTGRSLPLLDCPEANAPGMMPPPMGMVVDINATPLGQCRARLVAAGVDLNQYTTASAAEDVEEVRRALGYQQWNLLGGSYGTRLALEVARRYPAGLRTLLLDSVNPPDVDLLGEAGPNNMRVLDAVFSGCAAQPACAQAYPDLGRVYVEVVGSLNAEPARLLGGLLPLNGETFLQLSLLLLRAPATVAELPEIVFQARDKTYTVVERLLLQLVQSMAGGGAGGGVAMGLHLSVMCADYLPFTSRGAIDMGGAALGAELRGPLLRASLGYLENCRIWNVRPSPAAITEPVTSGIEALVLAGSLDPATPPSWAERAARTLPAGHYFELKGVSHGVFPTPCGSALLAPFLDAPGQKPAPACLGALTDVQFRVQR